MNILAMDLGKYKTVFCEYSAIDGEHTFGTVKTTPREIHDLIVEKEPDRVVMEVCSIAGWIGDITEALGIETEIANPMHEAWRWKNVKKKTDKEDALKLAKLSAMGQLPTVHMPSKPVREKLALIKHRQRLVHYRTSLKNAIRAIFARQGIAITRGAVDRQIKRLQTIHGVGPRLAETVVAFLDDPKRFKSGKEVGSYAGLVPRQYQSGQMERQGRTGGRGNKMLRNLLIEVCWASLASNAWARDTYKKLLRGSPSRKKIAITGLARSLVVRCWAMLRDEQNWKEPMPTSTG